MTPSICPRCKKGPLELMLTSPVTGVFEVYLCKTCLYAFRSTEPKENSDPESYPVSFGLTQEEIEGLPILPPIPPLREK